MTLKTRTLTKAFPILFALVFVLVWAAPVDAQHQHQNQRADTTQGMMKGNMMKGDMMQGEMMQGMMQMMKDPLHRSAMLVHMLPTMKEPLALSDDQVARMKQHAQKFGQQKEAHQKQMMQAKEQLQELLTSEDAAPDRVRSLLEESASHQAQMQALAYETASQMRGVLSAEQRTKLSGMKPMQMQHHMMANMSMMEMMQTMHGNMMQGGMMQGGMMNKQKR